MLPLHYRCPCHNLVLVLKKTVFFSPSGLKVWNLRGTCLVWVAKQTKQFVLRKPGGVRGTMGELSSVSETMFSFVEEIVGLSFQHLGAESTNAVIFTISRENIIHRLTS